MEPRLMVHGKMAHWFQILFFRAENFLFQCNYSKRSTMITHMFDHHVAERKLVLHAKIAETSWLNIWPMFANLGPSLGWDGVGHNPMKNG
ncbi:hypothetical protein PanWU01x14_127080 [Parasponia andersonii]|uniref:Uncharacterized protein n=1 Tax=Parasponia andersonii TaxID=3476 RepID=A0A2P5CT90_PARAD|nr:hypothetical protein PanWU01x14_127080 [Parasponia andersonii]